MANFDVTGLDALVGSVARSMVRRRRAAVEIRVSGESERGCACRCSISQLHSIIGYPYFR